MAFSPSSRRQATAVLSGHKMPVYERAQNVRVAAPFWKVQGSNAKRGGVLNNRNVSFGSTLSGVIICKR